MQPLHCAEVIYVLAYPCFAPPLDARINRFRAAHEPQRARLVPPHITLMFGVGEAHLGAVTDLVEIAARRTPAFKVAFSEFAAEFDPFEHVYKGLLFCSEGSGTLTALHDHLYQGAHRVALDTARSYRPHMTVAASKERAEIEAVDIAGIGALPVSATLNALTLVRYVDGSLTPLKTAPLLG